MDYSVILADPAWWYSNRKTGGERKDKTKFGGGAMKHYPLIKDKHLRRYARFLKKHTAENAALFLWSTMPRLDFAIECMKLAGFRYVTIAFTWVKYRQDNLQPIYGPGYYTASNAEVVLLGVKGKMKPVKKMTPSIIRTPRAEHSRKPDLYKEIDAMYPEGKRIELFARRGYRGWDCWGLETGKTKRRSMRDRKRWGERLSAESAAGLTSFFGGLFG